MSTEPSAAHSASPRTPPDAQLVWDLPLRICHWALALAVTGSFVTHYAGDRAFAWHVRSGYLTLLLVAFRIVWGFSGPRYARFGEIARTARAALARRAAPVRSPAHTALGGSMAVLLLVLLGAQALSGLFANDELLEAGPLTGWIGHGTSNWLSAWHENIPNVLLGAIAVHVASAAFYRWRRGDDRVTALVTGYKRGLPPGSAIGAERIGRALLVLAVVAAALFLIVWLAPPPADPSP